MARRFNKFRKRNRVEANKRTLRKNTSDVRRLTTSKSREIAFTPERLEQKMTAAGKPYILARGRLTYKKLNRFRTVLAFGGTAAILKNVMKIGLPIVMKGRTNLLVRDDGSLGGEYYTAHYYLGTLDNPAHPHSLWSGRTVTGHERSGYYRRQRYGKGLKQVKTVYIAATSVNGGSSIAA